LVPNSSLLERASPNPNSAIRLSQSEIPILFHLRTGSNLEQPTLRDRRRPSSSSSISIFERCSQSGRFPPLENARTTTKDEHDWRRYRVTRCASALTARNSSVSSAVHPQGLVDFTVNRIADLKEEDLHTLQGQVHHEYEAVRERGLGLDMTRGKPSPEQLDLATDLLTLPGTRDYFTEAGDDARNYGVLQGLPEARSLFSRTLGAPIDRIVASDNSSLAVMHDCILWALLKGVPGSAAPWSQAKAPTFVCPVPGYDRHFAICEEYGIQMLPAPMTGNGPDMDTVERLVADPAVKGMWCVPKYSNPTGEVYSDEIVRRLAAMRTAAPDFRLFWDNAYAVHHLTENRREIANILELCERAGNPDRAFVFASTSKVTLAGAGLAFFASSAANVRWYLGRAAKRTIGPDKLNQLRHVRFLKNEAGLNRLMDAHRALLVPKFDAVLAALESRLSGTGIAQWSRPEGGYFITVDVMEGTAKRVVELAKNVGLAITPAGATWPYGRDPYDRTLRLAPTFPPLKDVRDASEGIAICILLAAIEKHCAARKVSTDVA
jgi:DNA-binding transcriptional MocR family regulator